MTGSMTGSMGADVVTVLPEAILVAGAVACLLLGSWTPRTQQARVRLLAALSTAAMMALSVVGLVAGRRTAFSGTFLADELTGVLRLAVGASLLVLLLLAGTDVRDHPRESEHAVLLLLGGAGVVLLGAASDTAVLVVAFLLASIPLYGLLGLSPGARAPEATMKTYLVGALCGILMMLGTAVLLGLAGSTAYADLGTLDSGPATATGVVLLVVGLLFKAGAAPTHFWVPDATEASSVTAAAFLTTVPKLGAVVALARLLDALPAEPLWPLLVATLATVSMTLGNLVALAQSGVRRLLAWSTISQVGYLLTVAAAVPRADLATPTLGLFLAGYAVTNLGCFAAVAAEPTRSDLADWRGAARTRPALVAALGVLLLGLVGTPPTAVFVAKLLTLSATWEAGLGWLAVAVAVNTVVSLAYYLRWLAVCLRASDARHDDGRGGVACNLALACAGLAVVLGLLAGPVLAVAG